MFILFGKDELTESEKPKKTSTLLGNNKKYVLFNVFSGVSIHIESGSDSAGNSDFFIGYGSAVSRHDTLSKAKSVFLDYVYKACKNHKLLNFSDLQIDETKLGEVYKGLDNLPLALVTPEGTVVYHYLCGDPRFGIAGVVTVSTRPNDDLFQGSIEFSGFTLFYKTYEEALAVLQEIIDWLDDKGLLHNTTDIKTDKQLKAERALPENNV